LNYSIVEAWANGLGGAGNSGSDPMFADPVGSDGIAGTMDDNVRPGAGSPALGGGDPAIVPQYGEVDLVGSPRVLCGRIDIGAHEAGWGDFNCDGFIALSDGAGWAECLSGPMAGMVADECLGLDLDANGTVDLVDLSSWLILLEAALP
jgi:hypothetical protein